MKPTGNHRTIETYGYGMLSESKQSAARPSVNENWQVLCVENQIAEDTWIIRDMYDDIKKAPYLEKSKTVHLKSTTGELITDVNKQMELWVEYYSEL